MIIFRPTAALAKRMKLKLAASQDSSTTALGDWFARDLNLNRKQYVLCVSAKSRLPVILPAAPYANLPERLPNALSQVLAALKIPGSSITCELNEMASVITAKTDNKSVLGTINDYRLLLLANQYMGQKTLDNPVQTSLYLAGVPSGSLNYAFPTEAVYQCFGVSVSRSHLTLVD